MGLPLRGHRDAGALTVPRNCEEIDAKSGNLRALLQFRAVSGDADLRNHLATCNKNATYIGPQTQNDLISCIGEQIQSVLIQRVKDAKFFTVIADETTDVSRREQLSPCIRFIHEIHRGAQAIVRQKFPRASGFTALLTASTW